MSNTAMLHQEAEARQPGGKGALGLRLIDLRSQAKELSLVQGQLARVSSSAALGSQAMKLGTPVPQFPCFGTLTTFLTLSLYFLI